VGVSNVGVEVLDVCAGDDTRGIVGSGRRLGLLPARGGRPEEAIGRSSPKDAILSLIDGLTLCGVSGKLREV